MFPYHQATGAFLHAGPGGLGLVPGSRFRKPALASLLRLDGSGEDRVLATLSGRFVAVRRAGLRLAAHRDAPLVARWTVHAMPDGTAALSLGHGYLQADSAGGVAASAADAATALRFRLLSPRQAFRRMDERLVNRRISPQPNGRLLRFPHVAAPGDMSAELRNARVIGLDWIALMPGGARREQWIAHARFRAWHDVVAYPLPAPGRIATACLLGGHFNYYHNLVDYMLNWFEVRTRVAEDVPLITLPADQRFQAEILDAFGLSGRACPVAPLSATRVGRLVVPRPAVIGFGEVRAPAVIEACRAFLDACIAPAGDAPRRIFVSRALASRRRAANEAEAIAIAARHGFHAVALEGLGFLDQVALFRRAEAIAGLHGAGFANLIFAPPGCRVIELMPTEPRQPPYFANLSRGLGLPYEQVAAHGNFHARDLRIDLAGFEAALERGG